MNFLRSMTGFGQGEAENERYKITVEMKSVNHRFLEINARMPRQILSLEENVKKMIQSRLARGRIDLFINLEENSDEKTLIKVDKTLAMAYYKSLESLAEACGLATDMNLQQIASFPGVLTVEKNPDDLDSILLLLQEALRQALDRLIAMREAEGAKLSADIALKCQEIKKAVDKINEVCPRVVEDYRQKLTERINDLSDNLEIDPARIAMEVAIFAERSAIDEEITRLYSHLAQMAQSCMASEVIGRKLDFILQEMNREINTIGSKATALAIHDVVIEVKSLLEKIREQIQNIE